MKVFVKGKGETTLSDADFIASGGEGSIFAKAGKAFKIYTDPTKMIPVAKIDELSVLDDPRIIRPQEVLLDGKGKPIGYTMRHLSNTYALCQLFTRGFNDRNGIKPETRLDLARNMQAGYNIIHLHNCLAVDGNEMNFLTDAKFSEVYFLDVDSYQTPNYPATALMESIRDRHTKGFNKETDWFAWGIVTFQLLIGIHPYKGQHPSVKGLDDRMVQNISVFNKKVGIPPVCQPFTVIPQTLLQWYKAIFESGQRLAPPADFQGVIIVATQVRHISGTDKFEIKLLETAGKDIIDYVSVGGVKMIVTDQVRGVEPFIAITEKMSRKLSVGIDNGSIIVVENGQGSIPVSIAAEKLMAYNGNVYFKNGNKLHRLVFHDTGSNILTSSRHVANVHENATKLFDGIVVQSLLGVAHINVFPEPNTCRELAIKEIKGTIVDAKFDNNIAMIVAVDRKGIYTRYVLRFAPDFASYDLTVVPNITFTGLNFVVTDKGICCHINEKNEVELFVNKKGDPLMKVVADPMISADMKLFRDGNTVLFARKNELYMLKMK